MKILPSLKDPQKLAGKEQSSPDAIERDVDTEITEGEKLWLYRIKIALMIVLAGVSALLVMSYSIHSVWAGEWDRIEKFVIAVTTGIISTISVSYFFKK